MNIHEDPQGQISACLKTKNKMRKRDTNVLELSPIPYVNPACYHIIHSSICTSEKASSDDMYQLASSGTGNYLAKLKIMAKSVLALPKKTASNDCTFHFSLEFCHLPTYQLSETHSVTDQLSYTLLQVGKLLGRFLFRKPSNSPCNEINFLEPSFGYKKKTIEYLYHYCSCDD